MFKQLKYLLFLALFLVILLAAGFALMAFSAISLRATPLEFQISAGSSLRASAQQMRAQGVGLNPWLFSLLGKLMRAEASIKAGSYEINQGITPFLLIKKLSDGEVTQAALTFVEGETFRQMRARLDAHPALRHDSQGLSEAEILRRLGATQKHAEGLFFPDTYLVPKYSSDLALLARAYHAMQQHLAAAWATRAPDLPYRNVDELLTMASIIEKETGIAADRPKIAAVFVNRLRQGMLLQTDPSVIYGLVHENQSFDGNLRKRDLLKDTPYNTYTRAGLPPSPIALPGLASLQAAVHPEQSRALYFVARGDGSSQFSLTLDEHNQAVRRYQKGGKR
ncbi:MAG: endolytic transglycosylase MltG [Pseudomonadota bacterium]